MELLNLSNLSTNPLCLSLILLLSLFIWLKLGKGKDLNLPPSPPKLPIIGNIHQLGKLPHRSLRDLSNKYGPILLLRLGSNPTLVVSSSDMVREIVKGHDIMFSDIPRTAAVKHMLYESKGMGFGPYGEFWRQVRKMSIVELFSHQRVHSFQFVRDEEVGALINRIQSTCLKGEPNNLTKILMVVSSNIVSRCVCSQKIEEEDGRSKFGELVRRLVVLFTGFCIGDMFPYLRWADVLTGYIPRMKAVSAEMDAFLDQVIQEHRALESAAEVTHKKDFVSIIMQLQKDGILTQDNLKAILLEMFVAGTDTSSTLSEWMMAELLRHPNSMKKVQQEVRSVVGNKSKVDPEDIPKMEYLTCVVKEALRLHPPAVFLPRRTTATTSGKLGGYDIPSNTTVLINAWAIHRDPKWWEKPEEFIPERFEKSSIEFQGQYFHYIPFGMGRMGCPGMTFGVASVEYVLANLLYWFDWKLPAGEAGEKMDMSELYGLALAKGRNLNLSPSPPKLPIIGNIHQLGKLPHRALRDLSNKYGSLLLLRLGSNPTLVVSSVDMAREIVRSHDIAFSDRPRTTALNHLFYECKGEPINLTKMLTFVSSNIVSRCVFSHKIAEEDGCSKFGELVKRLMVLFTSFCFGDMFPYLSWADVLTGFVPSMKALSSDLDAFFDQCNMDDGSTPKASNPNAMKKVQQEVREVVANKSKVAPEDIHKMEYMKCVVKETLRLHPPAVFLPRKTSASVELGGYDIPSNTTEFINAWAIHRDPKWWEKPEEFIPERFDNSSIEFQGQDFHYIPFGMGRRGCPGMSFRVDLVEYVMANLLNWFDRKLPAGETAEKVDMTELNGLTVTKKTPIHVLPISHPSF
ncbi:hypothetical protein GQ457_15G016040 [Hibiscus cannabinus]